MGVDEKIVYIKDSNLCDCAHSLQLYKLPERNNMARFQQKLIPSTTICLFIRNLNLSIINSSLNITRGLSIDGASN